MEYQLAATSPSVTVRCWFDDDGLTIVEDLDERMTRLRFSEIRTVQLRQTLGAYVMRIETASTRPVTLRSRRVLGMDVEDRVDDYAAVARRLHELHRSNPGVRFVGGSSGLYWLGWAMMPIASGIFGLAAWMLLDEGPLRLAWSLVVVAALGLVGGSAGIWQGRARPYDPSAPPPRLVPS